MGAKSQPISPPFGHKAGLPPSKKYLLVRQPLFFCKNKSPEALITLGFRAFCYFRDGVKIVAGRRLSGEFQSFLQLNGCFLFYPSSVPEHTITQGKTLENIRKHKKTQHLSTARPHTGRTGTSGTGITLQPAQMPSSGASAAASAVQSTAGSITPASWSPGTATTESKGGTAAPTEIILTSSSGRWSLRSWILTISMKPHFLSRSITLRQTPARPLHFTSGMGEQHNGKEYKGDTLNRSAACGRAGSHGRKAQGRCLRPRFYGQGRAVHQLRGADRLLHQLHQEPP